MSKAKISYKDRFGQFQHQAIVAYEAYYVWKALQKPENQEIYNANSGFWSVALLALQNEWFMGLARLYEESSHSQSGKVISVHSLVSDHPNQERAKLAKAFVEQNRPVLNNIARIRDHRLAHNNAQLLTNPKEFEKRFSIKYADLDRIFEFTAELLGILYPDDGHGYALDHLKSEAEHHTDYLIDGLKYFYEQRKEHINKFVRGEINNPTFPPKN